MERVGVSVGKSKGVGFAVGKPVWVSSRRGGGDGDVVDSVNHPPHYTQYEGFEVIDITEQLNFNLGNVVKYVLRAGSKGDVVTDLRKAEWYIRRELKRVGAKD